MKTLTSKFFRKLFALTVSKVRPYCWVKQEFVQVRTANSWKEKGRMQNSVCAKLEFGSCEEILSILEFSALQPCVRGLW